MSSQEQRPVTGAAAASLGLLVVGIAVLGTGRFVRLGKTVGYESDARILPLGFIAVVLAIAAIGVAVRDRTARLWLGGAFAVLDAVLIWQSITNVYFRFGWGGDEGEMLIFEVGLGLLALLLFATAFQPAQQNGVGGRAEGGGKVGAGRWLVRTVLYLAGIALAVIVGFFNGVGLYDMKRCSYVDACADDDLGGLVWGVSGSLIGVGVSLVLVVVLELVLQNRRQRQRKVGTPA
ncbi:hypothetical protein [Streptomyces sp. SID13031]|uniref:hypothetical protein n=1 Tax=Streptomyces sp. SID13031 TaxID=2706046 RepID=UPI0013C78920|nr:hypothetical protein [Streptomyces sp. SID13031]NEA37255.1 hypothetical protein [Streptomyces sp. SID13031]